MFKISTLSCNIPSVALKTPWQLWLLVPEVACPRSPAELSSVRRSFWFRMALVIGLQHCSPDMLIQGVQVGWIWRPLVFGSEIWADGLEPVLHGTSYVCWRAILLKDVSTGQQSSAVVDKTGKEMAKIVHRIHFSSLVNKVESSLATKTWQLRPSHAASHLTFSQKTAGLMSALLPPGTRPDFVVLVADRRV